MENKIKKILAIILIIVSLVLILIGITFIVVKKSEVVELVPIFKYVASEDTYLVEICSYEENTKCKNIPRGEKIKIEINEDVANQEYTLISYENEFYYINNYNLVDTLSEVVLEKNIYVRTNLSLLESKDDSKILSLIKKGEQLEIIGYDQLNADGTVNMYKIKWADYEGYVYSKYLVFTYEEAILNYDEENSYQIHLARTNQFGGGSAGNLDYYPYEKPKFDDNVMPEEVRSLYLNSGSTVISNIDEYINYAKSVNINTFIVDIKDNEAPGYKSEVMRMYSPTNYQYANNSFEDYKIAITKLKEAGFYVVGRITVFKDKYYVIDNPQTAIEQTTNNTPIILNGTYWPSAFDRDVWEFNVQLAKEAINEMGFHEIQFDYVRFPDKTLALEYANAINFKNVYGEDKAQAIQTFLMYACDELHKLNAYVSADVFGESAHTYVSAYGQYWPAISNVVDVISGMPYPDHFGMNEYGFTTPPYKNPYEILNYWGQNFVMKRQSEIDSPAVVRTWIQAYDALPGDFPYLNPQIEDQIQGLYDAGLTGGFMPWNSASSLAKYKVYENAFLKEYK